MAFAVAQLSSYKPNINLEVLQPFNNRVKLPSMKFSVQCHCPTILHNSPALGKEAELIKPLTDGIGDGNANAVTQRNVIRLGLPSKGRMADGTLALLKDCQLGIRQVNPRQYIAHVPEISNLEVWFQREKDIVRKLLSGDLDFGIAGYDMVSEHGQGNEDLILVHDALGFGECHLSLAIPNDGVYKNICTLDEFTTMPQWTTERPLRIATGYTHLGKTFAKENGLKHVMFSTADGELAAAPAMGIADAILDIVSSGTALRENNLKEIEGGLVLESQGVLVANKKALIHRRDVLETVHEMLERIEARLKALGEFTVTANMRGNSAQEVAERILRHTDFPGFQGPTVSPVHWENNGEVEVGYYAIVICVPKHQLYESVCQLRAAGGSGVLVSPLTYIFDEEPSRWRKLLDQLNL